MISQLLIHASQDERLGRLITGNPLTRAVAQRFVAGDTLEDGIRAATELHQRGHTVSLDLVGEHVGTTDAADEAAHGYQEAIAALRDRHLAGGISVKPTQLGLTLDPNEAARRLGDIAAAAKTGGFHVTLDMEDSSTTAATVDLVTALHQQGHDHVGCAVQAYLHRTPADVEALSAAGASLRLCKGAYAEPDDVAYKGNSEVDAAYRELASYLLERGTYPRFATHDHRLIGFIRREARRLGRSTDEYEFQMLYGVRPDVQDRLAALGERVCVYVPYGPAWYPYFMRRLAERPANIAFFLRALVG